MRGNIKEALGELDSTSELEDDIYLHIDKLLALCMVQTALDSGDQVLPLGIRNHYSLLMEEQVRALRTTVDKLFG